MVSETYDESTLLPDTGVYHRPGGGGGGGWGGGMLKKGAFFCTQVRSMGGENPLTIHEIYAALTPSDSHVTGLKV